MSNKVWLEKTALKRRVALQWYATCGCFDEDVMQIKRLLIHHQQVTVLGGDGTLNLVVNALLNGNELDQIETPKRMAILPCGTGNDFARALGYSTKQWRESIFSGCARHIDVGKVNTRYFINMAGLGFNAEVVAAMAGKKRFGALSYTLYGVAKLFTYRGVTLKVNGFEQEVMMCLFANGRHFAAGLTPAPSARVDCGELQMLTICTLSLSKRLLCFALMLFGVHTKLPWVKVCHGRHFDISTEGVSIEADGDVIAATPAKISALAASLRLNIPSAGGDSA
ncbi:diacylglycerol/lipid kinase family protein [Pseudoalteromonas luteoviolacea]|uniref:diacylglycerol/lipid kinase family protein n=1 Tax=Pseudoalteromonas luteoviolacea TaxID=43657 RepID=UPI0012D3943F|nr:YegS/Rv2252/BmrU family lipid kinase [Pseudoalteromonas luteoviolacea]